MHSCRTIAPVTGVESSYSGDYIHKMIAMNQPDLSTYSSGRMTISIVENDEQMVLRGAVRIKKDSAVFISINAFAGIEAARFLFTPDSVKMIDRINNAYFMGSYSESRKFIPFAVNFDLIQNIFFASPLRFSDEIDLLEGSDKEYLFEQQFLKFRFSGNDILFADNNVSDDMLQLVIDRDFLTRSVDFHSGERNVYASLKYNSFYKTEGFNLPDQITLNFVSHNLPLQASLQLGRIEINRDLSFPFSIPSRYTRLKN
jgi:hypothetical protein